jgi:hypothetical protein
MDVLEHNFNLQMEWTLKIDFQNKIDNITFELVY